MIKSKSFNGGHLPPLGSCRRNHQLGILTGTHPLDCIRAVFQLFKLQPLAVADGLRRGLDCGRGCTGLVIPDNGAVVGVPVIVPTGRLGGVCAVNFGVGASLESIIPYLGHAVRNGDGGQEAAAGESPPPYCGHTVRNGDGGQVAAPNESPLPYRGHTVRNSDGGQTSAFFESR